MFGKDSRSLHLIGGGLWLAPGRLLGDGPGPILQSAQSRTGSVPGMDGSKKGAVRPAGPGGKVGVAFCACAATLACGGGLPQIERRVADLQARLDEVAAATRASQSRQAAIEGRLLVLQDEVETLRMALRRPGPVGTTSLPAATPVPSDLPTVRLTPPQEPPSEGIGRAGSAASVMDESIYQEIDEEGNVVTPAGGRKSATRESKPARSTSPPLAKASERQSESDAVIAEYQSALELYRQGRMVEARTAFEAFAARYPRHPYADNALYWVGECLYDQKDYEGARRAFLRVLTEHPDGNKVPDAMVKVGLCDRALGRHEDAARMFRTVMLTYPDTEAAAVAMRLAGELP